MLDEILRNILGLFRANMCKLRAKDSYKLLIYIDQIIALRQQTTLLHPKYYL
jgi:hypothetical protein